MKHFGFTMSEVLITLGIIGVIAAITAPGLIMHGKDEANAAKLAVTVSNIENAFTSAIVQEGAADIYGTSIMSISPLSISNAQNNAANVRTFVGNLGKYLVTKGYKDSKANVYGSEDIYKMAVGSTKGDVLETNFFNGVPVILKNGAVAFISLYDHDSEITSDVAAARGTAMTSVAAKIVIDVNGAAKPNIVGRDLFQFWVGQNGVLYPIGGLDVSALTGNVGNDWTNSEQLSCPPSVEYVTGQNQERTFVDGWGCTARLLEENYKMNY